MFYLLHYMCKHKNNLLNEKTIIYLYVVMMFKKENSFN